MAAPIALFAYKRANELKQTVQALQANYLASESDLYVFVDGPRRQEDVAKVEAVREVVKAITGFRSVKRFISETNKGCAASIISGVSQVLEEHESIVVVEDDIVTTPNFLDFINQGLKAFKDNERVFSIGGYTFPFVKPDGYEADGYFFGRTCAWGWGIWTDRWKCVDWEVSDFREFMQDVQRRKAFNLNGSDRVRMLSRTMNREVDAWDIRLCYCQFNQGGLTLYPTISKVNNIGFYSNDGVNTNVYNRYRTPLDDGTQREFNLEIEAVENPVYGRQFRRKFSLSIRVYNRLKTIAGLR